MVQETFKLCVVTYAGKPTLERQGGGSGVEGQTRPHETSLQKQKAKAVNVTAGGV